ncbi:MAG: HD domain-containing protein [Solirubrobacterales bacterium]
MSSDRPSDARSPTAESELELAALARERGEELIEALESQLEGAREHAEATGAYAFAAAVELGHGRGRAALVRETGRLHEIGRVYGRDLEAHHGHGAQLARGAGIPEQVCGWIAAAGARYDGGGSRELAGERIPEASRVVRAACELARALAGGGPDAESALRARAGTELDPAVVDALASVLSRSR